MYRSKVSFANGPGRRSGRAKDGTPESNAAAEEPVRRRGSRGGGRVGVGRLCGVGLEEEAAEPDHPAQLRLQPKTNCSQISAAAAAATVGATAGYF